MDSKDTSKFEYKVNLMGCPVRADVEWNTENLANLKKLGFNTMQLNIAWGNRPADEPLCLEDVIALPDDKKHLLHDELPPDRAIGSQERRAKRRADLKHRIALCKEMGMRSIFHFGAPNVGQYAITLEALEKKMTRCLLDGKTGDYYVAMLEAFAAEYEGVDDILVYTYDQDAWLCSEFGSCEHCQGIPLDERVVPFLNLLSSTWQRLNPDGRLWWEPWELSGGQALKCVEKIDPEGFGLMLHCNIAEVMVTMPVDRWLKNTCKLAKSRGITVIVEGFFGAPSEEVEPYRHLAYPQVVLNELKAIAAVDGVVGIKEYFGSIPAKEDANLRMTGLYLNNPQISEHEALKKLAEPYGDAAAEIIEFWKMCSKAMELFPWEVSWFVRNIGNSNISHGMQGAFIRGQMLHTPSWDSTRSAIFMKTDSVQPTPWMLEDIQLQFTLAAEALDKALVIGAGLKDKVPANLKGDLEKCLEEFQNFRKRTLSYVYHLRETNLATIMRRAKTEGTEIPARVIDEMAFVLQADNTNQGGNPELEEAIALFAKDIDAFLEKFFVISDVDNISKGYNTLTTR